MQSIAEYFLSLSQHNIFCRIFYRDFTLLGECQYFKGQFDR